MKGLSKVTMDGNTAAAYASYAFTEVAAIYPITPSSQMAEVIDEWSATGKRNVFGKTVELREMQSEGGAAGTVHGSLQAGAITSTYTASQGLMLMIPNMYKIAGELLPCVFHVSARALASNALSIFGDHSDVMACRQTGFSLLASSNVQDAFYLGCVAHLVAIKSRIPVLHFFDGFRTSHEYQKIDVIDYDILKDLIDYDALDKFRGNSLNPNHPAIRGTAQNPDIFFQTRESINKFYTPIPEIVQGYMDKINEIAGTNYKLYNYYGAEDAENIIISMGSSCDVTKETIDYQNSIGKKYGLLEVHLYRPFAADYFLKAIPKSVKKIAVLDRTKEPGALGEPLYMDVKTIYSDVENAPLVVGGRYGLGSKDFTPFDVMSVYANLENDKPMNGFTVGINDDVTYHSLPKYPEKFNSTPEGNFSFKFWGLGADGTVSANKSAVKIIGDYTDYNAQAYFAYDSKKSGGLTVSHLRMGPKKIKGSYQIQHADFVACHNQAYVKLYDLLGDIAEGGRFLLNTIWTTDELESELPGRIKRDIYNKKVEFYTLDAVSIAKEIGLGSRINMIMQAAFFKLTNILPIEDATKYLKDSVEKSYGKQGQVVINMNNSAIDKGISMIKRIDVPKSWADAKDTPMTYDERMPAFVKDVMKQMAIQKGNDLPVSTFNGREDGSFPSGVTTWEKRGFAIDTPSWKPENCIQCNQCSFVCPHSVIRPTLLTDEEAINAPKGYDMLDANGSEYKGKKYHLAISALDCTGCGICVKACPSKVKALEFVPLSKIKEQSIINWNYTTDNVDDKKISERQMETVKGSQFLRPYIEFSGACAGCGETPYAKLITQLYGDRMMVANSAGCSHIWGGSPEVPYTVNKKGMGPAWASSLFEDNAEYGYGMFVGAQNVRKSVKMKVEEAINIVTGDLKNVMMEWLEGYNISDGTVERAEKLESILKKNKNEDRLLNDIYSRRDYFIKQSQWIFGGDGWAYDIGFGGLDHVIASGENVNLLVMDTEVYSNTGGQSSKATPTAAIAQFAASGKKTKKKDLGVMAMSYGYVYVAQVAMGYDKAQTLKAIREAESYDGPSIVIAYAPCINHGIKGGMSESQEQAKRAVESGYWACYRFDPRRKDAGENPFVLDSKKPTADFKEFLSSEVRYSSLKKKFPELANELFNKADKDAKDRMESYYRLAGL